MNQETARDRMPDEPAAHPTLLAEGIWLGMQALCGGSCAANAISQSVPKVARM